MATKTKKELPKKNPKLVIPFTSNDLEELMSGETFKWTFATEEGQDIDVLLRLETESDIEDEDNTPDTSDTDLF